MDRLQALKFFLEVAEKRSFSAAARSLQVPTSSVSRRIRDLETELGAELLHRTTRVVKLTELGTLYAEQVRPAVRALEDADEVVSQHSSLPAGRIRITSIPGYGRYCLMPALTRFTERFPETVIDIDMTDQVLSLANNEVDLAVRTTGVLPERAVARKLNDNHFVLVASPHYLARHDRPRTTADLQDHRTLLYRRPNGILNWQARVEGEWEELRGVFASGSRMERSRRSSSRMPFSRSPEPPRWASISSIIARSTDFGRSGRS